MEMRLERIQLASVVTIWYASHPLLVATLHHLPEVEERPILSGPNEERVRGFFHTVYKLGT